MLKALVIVCREKTKDVGSLLSIARAEAQKREHTHENVTVKNILYDPVTGVYIALYEAPKVLKPSERKGLEKGVIHGRNQAKGV